MTAAKSLFSDIPNLQKLVNEADNLREEIKQYEKK